MSRLFFQPNENRGIPLSVTEDDLANALRAWGEGMVSISSAYRQRGYEDARNVAKKLISDLYGYSMGSVLFKPTLSGGVNTFRTSEDGALSYFVGGNSNYPDDSGFAIKGWRQVFSETKAVFLDNEIALWMGWVTLVGRDGESTIVDKSFGYKLCEGRHLKIVLHHSSLPYVY